MQACKTFVTLKTHRKRGSFANTYSCVSVAAFASILLRAFVCCSLGNRVETCLLVISRKCTCPMPLPFCYCARVTMFCKYIAINHECKYTSMHCNAQRIYALCLMPFYVVCCIALYCPYPPVIVASWGNVGETS